MGNSVLDDVTLEGDGKSFIIDNGARKEANVTPLPLYGFDSGRTDVFDFGGVVRVINLTGIYVGTSISDVKSWILNLESKAQGKQDVQHGYPITFQDDYRKASDDTDMQVKVMEVSTTVEQGDPYSCRWSLKIVESSDVA